MQACSFFEEIAESIRSGDRDPSYERLRNHFLDIRRRSRGTQWKEYTALFRRHALHRMLCQCPLIRRAFQKPRGYAGDPLIFDFLYSRETLPADTSPLGESLYRWQFEQDGSRSARARLRLIGDAIDALAGTVSRPRILAVACGHLREAHLSTAVARREIGRFFALDGDSEALEAVEREQPSGGIETVNLSVRGLLSGKRTFEGLDLAYSAGVFNCLGDATGTRLARVLFDMLRPGGSLLMVNCAPNLPELAFMEASMDWWVNSRDEAACERLTGEIPLRHPRRAFRDGFHNMVFVEVTKTD
jgi:hypothetical protein